MVRRDASDDSSCEGEAPLQELEERVFREYLDRLNRGGSIDPAEVQKEHPGIAQESIEQLEVFRDVVPGDRNEQALGMLGDFRLLWQLGRGGMGVVYEAWQGSMARPVALKVLPAGIAADSRAVTRLVREAQIAGKLRHPNVVSVFGMGVEANTPYFAMEMVDGETLAQVLARMKSG